MAMYCGIQLQSPQGVGPMIAGKTYHLLRNCMHRSRVLLVHFPLGNRPHADLTIMSSVMFEDAVCPGAGSPRIIPVSPQKTLPPWLSELECVDLSALEINRDQAKKSNLQTCDRRVFSLTPLLNIVEVLMLEDDIELQVNRIARFYGLNERRARVWFLTYLCFSRNRLALYPTTIHSGRFKRGSRLIAKGNENAGTCLNETALKDMVAGYWSMSGIGVTQCELYDRTMTEWLGCIAAKDAQGEPFFKHPDGNWMPTFDVWRYRMIQEIGLATIQTRIYGEHTMRTNSKTSEGSFAEFVPNLMSVCLADAYRVNEAPRGFLEGNPIAPLLGVTGMCAVSGLLAGIGFCFGSEYLDGYRMMQFCMAVDKRYFCSLFGIEIDETDWPSIGMPSHGIFDRGAGAGSLDAAGLIDEPAVRELAMSYSGQGKAPIESSNPREFHHDGPPSHFQSDLNPIQIARREIRRLITFNQSSKKRLTPMMIRTGVRATGLGIWNYLDSRGRNAAQPMPLAAAIRKFLTPVSFSIREDGVYLGFQRYDSPDLRSTGLLRKRSRVKDVKVAGYALAMAVRTTWVELDGHIFEVTGKLPHSDHPEQLNRSYVELELEDDLRRKGAAKSRQSRHAARALGRQEFKKETGKDWSAGSRKAGAPKRHSAESRLETADAKPLARRRAK